MVLQILERGKHRDVVIRQGEVRLGRRGREAKGHRNRKPSCHASRLWWRSYPPAFSCPPARPLSSDPILWHFLLWAAPSSSQPDILSGQGRLGRELRWAGPCGSAERDRMLQALRSPWGTAALLAPCPHNYRYSSCLLGSPTLHRGLPTLWGW